MWALQLSARASWFADVPFMFMWWRAWLWSFVAWEANTNMADAMFDRGLWRARRAELYAGVPNIFSVS